MNRITVTDSDNKSDLTIESQARWLCLMEAVNTIGDKADDIGADYEKMLKPIPIDKYIKERFPAMVKDLEYEEKHQL